ncbi:MAG TPA: hypothetical protein VH234_01085 [Candidatus Saccharimonadales bacterium]|jgi:hypothetical protein|nr:hypothetical protein [Candidatus Saccharimonadales bacterium]
MPQVARQEESKIERAARLFNKLPEELQSYIGSMSLGPIMTPSFKSPLDQVPFGSKDEFNMLKVFNLVDCWALEEAPGVLEAWWGSDDLDTDLREFTPELPAGNVHFVQYATHKIEHLALGAFSDIS